jgi:AbrB family looped-hinge helix DNA binding protein
MSVHLTIDKAGRVVIPKATRKALRLEPGDVLEMDRAGEQITLRPLRVTGPLDKEQGVWVFRTWNLIRHSFSAARRLPAAFVLP